FSTTSKGRFSFNTLAGDTVTVTLRGVNGESNVNALTASQASATAPIDLTFTSKKAAPSNVATVSTGRPGHARSPSITVISNGKAPVILGNVSLSGPGSQVKSFTAPGATLAGTLNVAGSVGDVSLKSADNLAAPTGLSTSAPSTSGGALSASTTYFYEITATTATSESPLSQELS